ncbi:hypothetical protein HRR80_007965 [Exophiala dermatitidis]|uniref:Uncharacterized protein n=1 Tax=Exophiala dermatitidis TaxID=5970 RepID=A0AAN6IRL5_EXODE|nr:hypothetical protein HRR73_007940 [Exophiala dermatitidis]KAJ4507713.1 hypothetical protein HRR74_008041 [Exophiala dermatitidis]KAJ4535286.1 hypothetical protein HRR77_008196 [Exophiala dermatitidis]KAJ4560736.1 hypothetical protein HRR79_007858 [Exophiala dermatitidis]KAJ4625043.1 hypothetical protein HRR88_004754 [Exophiala dermatitidis]
MKSIPHIDNTLEYGGHQDNRKTPTSLSTRSSFASTSPSCCGMIGSLTLGGERDAGSWTDHRSSLLPKRLFTEITPSLHRHYQSAAWPSTEYSCSSLSSPLQLR